MIGMKNKQFLRRYAVGDLIQTEFGLQHEDENVKIQIKNTVATCKIIKITIDEKEYNSEKKKNDIIQTPFVFEHKSRGWLIKIGYEQKYLDDKYTLEINGEKYEEMAEAPP